ncbi:hypothetical protein [Nonomuraea rhodomycinica]|uniref:MmpS family membrane protein n=1 Tax=Nonomuraea rhodomycinica TaxID=1712872 RepID=A0A7Y6IMP7_9ACTN|nr:hypothetical protein [Nonomuraea rhodomycinica]NUW39729.1 hypothetical protein [Nonomuraea rhodomycinica]
MPQRNVGLLVAGVAAVAGLAGCGGATSPASGRETAPPAVSSSEPVASAPVEGTTAVRTVKLEVLGEGRAVQPIMYVGDFNGTETGGMTLPWSKTVTLELTPAEQKVGKLVSVVAGGVQTTDGQIAEGSCRISVDGRKVVAAKGLCEYKVK